MTWPTVPLAAQARAILLLPAGFRAYDEDFTVQLPAPVTIVVEDIAYERMQIHHGGLIDHDARVLYVLGGLHLPHGSGDARLDPDEALDQ